MGHVVDGDELLNIQSLPTDVLVLIFSFCDDVSLGRLSRQCRRFYEIIKEDWPWVAKSREVIITNMLSKEMEIRTRRKLSYRERCRVSSNWSKGRFKEHVLFPKTTRPYSYIWMNSDYLWLTKLYEIVAYKRQCNGINTSSRARTLCGHSDYVCCFVKSGDLIISAGSTGQICGWNCGKGKLLIRHHMCHNGRINSMSLVSDMLVTGSIDRTFKIWRWSDYGCIPLLTINVRDLVLSTSLNRDGDKCAVGSAGNHHVPPLHVYDMHQGREVMCHIDRNVRAAHVMDTVWESSHLFYSAGLDGYIRLWDTRVGRNVNSWLDPFDSKIISLRVDHKYAMVSGTENEGRTILWDRRQSSCVQMFGSYGANYKPVWSLAFDPCHLFISLEESLIFYDFFGKRNKPVNRMLRL